MRMLLKFGLVISLCLAATQSFAGQMIDRLVASVDNVPILQSDWDQAVAFEALEEGRATASLHADERRSVLDRLVDQQLLRAQMGDENIATADQEEIDRDIAKLRDSYPQAKTNDGWQTLLAQYGLDEAYVRQRVARQLQVMRFVDLRLRPETRVPREDVEDYYKETLVPTVRSQGAQAASLSEVYPKIEEILRQQRLDELLTTWLHDLRDHSNIQWLGVEESVPAENTASADGSGDE